MFSVMTFKNYLAEFIGTFALVFIGAGAVLVNGLTNGAVGVVGIALAHGLVLMTMIYSLAHISGAHFNPAVTIAMLVNKRIELAKAVTYLIAQLLGASVAGLLLLFLYPQASGEQLYGFPPELGFGFGTLLEAVLTFFLVFTIYGVAVNKQAPVGFFGLAIGAVLIYDIVVGGTQTGAAMNPARAFGPALASGVWSPQLIYWIGPIFGALVASFVYEYLFLEKQKSRK